MGGSSSHLYVLDNTTDFENESLDRCRFQGRLPFLFSGVPPNSLEGQPDVASFPAEINPSAINRISSTCRSEPTVEIVPQTVHQFIRHAQR
jgi:hypothetical protein